MKEIISDLISKKTKLKKEEVEKLIEIPPNIEMGDYAFPCFALSKELRKNPNEVALELSRDLNKKLVNNIQKIENKGPYVNFFIDKHSLIKDVLSKASNESYGSQKQKNKILIEHTSVNPNASPHVGRARNSIIGDSIVRILKFLGNNVEIHYYVNDVSKQIAMLALEYNKGDKFDDMLNKYISISSKIKDNPELENQVFNILEKFENKDKQTVKLFKEIVGICVNGQKEIFASFGINFDYFDYESEYVGEKSDRILELLKKSGKLFQDKEDRLVLDLSHTQLIRKMKAPYFVLARSNGTGLYGLRDISYTIDKMNKNKGGRNIIVLGEDQKLYFEQIKESLKILGYNFPEVVHYSFVLIQENGKAKKMSTRKGELVLLEEFFDQAVKRAKEEVKKRKTKGDAKKIALAAIKYAMLKNDNDKNIIFSWDNSLNFEGDSGPYLQYSYARSASILRKENPKPKYSLPDNLDDSEIMLAKKISQFPQVVLNANNKLNPSILANYSFELCQYFNEFYHKNRVIGDKYQDFRLHLVKAFNYTIKNSLYLLGIEVMEEM